MLTRMVCKLKAWWRYECTCSTSHWPLAQLPTEQGMPLMTKKPVNVGPTDDVIALDRVARKIAKILDDAGYTLGIVTDEHGVTSAIVGDRPVVPVDVAVPWTSVTIDAHPVVWRQR